jgi:hypothetical protein
MKAKVFVNNGSKSGAREMTISKGQEIAALRGLYQSALVFREGNSNLYKVQYPSTAGIKPFLVRIER